ncbi:hypothetical protein [Paenibacillus taichungensis]|uniref:Uncharacterized protein n=1 Tax=Paenibacillus taichungensis TaxID=484184 RepID=A0A329QMX6_9BACL|nr:hypothetical protein [Paenibacillus taichungensis]RAW13707.1 hypothetical protein DC345_18130 [Paenibacillus taichungensis]
MELGANQIEVGEQYILIEEPFYGAIVTILIDESGKSPNWVGWIVRVDENLAGMEQPIGKEITVGWNKEYKHYCPAKFYALEVKSPPIESLVTKKNSIRSEA